MYKLANLSPKKLTQSLLTVKTLTLFPEKGSAGARREVLGGLSVVPGPLSSIIEVYACLLVSFFPSLSPSLFL